MLLSRHTRRREFITLLGGAAGWPLTARGQQAERMRRIGVLMSLAPEDSEGQARFTAFVQGLQELGWTDRRNVRIDTRWGAGDADRTRKYAVELVALAPFRACTHKRRALAGFRSWGEPDTPGWRE